MIEKSVGAFDRDKVAVWEVKAHDEGGLSCSVAHVIDFPDTMEFSRLTCMASHTSDLETLLIAGESLQSVRCVVSQATFKIFS